MGQEGSDSNCMIERFPWAIAAIAMLLFFIYLRLLTYAWFLFEMVVDIIGG